VSGRGTRTRNNTHYTQAAKQLQETSMMLECAASIMCVFFAKKILILVHKYLFAGPGSLITLLLLLRRSV
jgi:hypothetical protein